MAVMMRSAASQRRVSRVRWASSTRGTFLFIRFALGMAPSIARACSRPQPRRSYLISFWAPKRCDPPHTARIRGKQAQSFQQPRRQQKAGATMLLKARPLRLSM
jgi:hypothetical protein